MRLKEKSVKVLIPFLAKEKEVGWGVRDLKEQKGNSHGDINANVCCINVCWAFVNNETH